MISWQNGIIKDHPRHRLKIGFPWSAGSSPAVRTIALLATLATAACDRVVEQRGPIVVAAIGGAPRLARPGASTGMPDRLLLDSVAQGLVRFDAAGQVEPGLAERWIVIDGGQSYIFRLREARWADGSAIDAGQVARLLRRAVRTGGGNPLEPWLSAIESVVAMTPQVIEVRLSRPRPDLLKLFAQPELALVRAAPATGSGPFRIVDPAPAPLLRPLANADADTGADDADSPSPRDLVRLRGERAARAILRFASGGAELVTGGTFEDWPLLSLVTLPRGAVRIDPAMGLFGFAITRRDGFLADAAGRTAINEAMDRAAIVAAVAPDWEPLDRLLPDGLDIAAPPQVAPWTLLTLDERRAEARARVAAFPGGVTLRVALPPGPGATRLWGAVAASLAAIGVAAERVEPDAPADLTLVDAVAPYDNARWYLGTACRLCGPAATDRLEAARLAPTLATRAAATAEADAALNADVAFIPLARPLRWSLVGPGLTAWTPNVRAWHPLNRLRAEPN